MKITQMIKNWRLYRQKKRAIKKAEQMAKLSGRRFYVFLITGKFYVFDRREYKLFVKANKLNWQTDPMTLERLAVYVSSSQIALKQTK